MEAGQLPSSDMCKVPDLHDRNGPTHLNSLPTWLASAERGGTQAHGAQGWGTGPREKLKKQSADKYVCSHTPPPTALAYITKLYTI